MNSEYFKEKDNLIMDQDSECNKEKSIISELKSLSRFFYIKNVPSYGNNFFFTIGIYLLELFIILAVTGMIMLIFGPYWWDLTATGSFLRSIHLWAAEAFVTLMLIHLLVNLFTSAFKKKKLIWMMGIVLLLLTFLDYAFGIGIRGGFVSQFNDKAGADLWNGMGFGHWVNPLNYGALLGWHIAIIPIILIVLIFVHYMLVKTKGLSKPYRSDIPYTMVKADHKKMYRRMVYIFVIVILFAVFARAPYVSPLTITSIAQKTPNIMATTLLNEFNHTSGTAVYKDTIDPYKFNTRDIYVTIPYTKYVNTTGMDNKLNTFYLESNTKQNDIIKEAFAYFKYNKSIDSGINSNNSLISVVSVLTKMAQNGLYGSVLQSENISGLNETYKIRFFADTKILYSVAKKYGLRTSQWGMIKAGGTWWPIGSYWVAPYNLMEMWFPNSSDLQDGVVALSTFIILLLLPYIPFLNEIPDKLKLYKIFWNRFTIPELKNRKKDKQDK